MVSKHHGWLTIWYSTAMYQDASENQPTFL